MTIFRLLKLMAGIAIGATAFFVAVQASMAQENAAKLSKYKKENATFTTKLGRTYQASSIQKVTATYISVLTDSGIERIKPDDMPDDFRKSFGLSAAAVQAAKAEFERKSFDAKKAAFRTKKARTAVSGLKHRLTLTVFEKVDIGAVCDARFFDEVTEIVRKRVRTGSLDRNQDGQTKSVKVKVEKAVGVDQKILVRGLPKTLKPGSPWEGDVYIVGYYVFREKSLIPGRTAPGVDIPMAFVKFNDAVAYKAATPDDGSAGDASGTGVVISKSGHILTSYRLILDADTIMVTTPGLDRALKAQVVAKDAKENLAVLKVATTLKPVPISLTPKVSLGQEIFTIGYPDMDVRSTEAKITEGNIAALKGPQNDIRYFQVEGEFQAGNFGGAIFDSHGTVIGILTPSPPENFFIDGDQTDFEPLFNVTKGTRFNNLLKKVPGFKAETKASKEPKVAAQEAAVLVTVKRRRR